MIQLKEEQRLVTAYWQGQAIGSLSKDLVGKNRLQAFASSFEEARSFFFDWEKQLVYRLALKLLSRRSYFTSYLESVLQKKGASFSSARWAVNQLEKKGYINNRDYLRRLILSSIEKRQSPAYIFKKLLVKNVDYEEAKSLLVSLYTQEKQKQVMQMIAQKKQQTTEELRAYFSRKGFFFLEEGAPE